MRESKKTYSLSKPTTLNIHIQYQYENGYAEVANLSLQGKSEDMKYRTVLFNVPDSVVSKKRGVRVGENLVKAITNAKKDSVLWANTGIIQRTESEERLAFGMSSELFMKSEHPRFSPALEQIKDVKSTKKTPKPHDSYPSRIASRWGYSLLCLPQIPKNTFEKGVFYPENVTLLLCNFWDLRVSLSILNKVIINSALLDICHLTFIANSRTNS